MKHQLIAGAGLVAVMLFCGYMIAQLHDGLWPVNGRPQASLVLNSR